MSLVNYALLDFELSLLRVKLDAKGQGKPCGKGFISARKKCGQKGREQLASDLKTGDEGAKMRVARGKELAKSRQELSRQVQADKGKKARDKVATPVEEPAKKPKTPRTKKAAEPSKPADVGPPIKNSQDFQKEALNHLAIISRDRNQDGLVPIYRLRQELGGRVSREEFDKWSRDLESNDKIQIMEESVEDGDPGKIADGIEIRGKKKTYMKILQPPSGSVGSSPVELARKARLPKSDQINNPKEFESAFQKELSNLDPDGEGFIPIYKLRRTLGDRVTRKEFSDYLFDMQSRDKFQLTEGTVEDNERSKLEDSVQTKLGKLRAYIKLPSGG